MSVASLQSKNKMGNYDHELHELHKQLNDPNFHYPKLSNEREEWRGQEAREVRDLREQQERNWWLDKQYEWMKKSQSEGADLDILLLHKMQGEMIEKDKEREKNSSESESPFLTLFFIIGVIIVFCLCS